MNTVTKTKLTIMLDTQVYEGIRAKVGGRRIGAYLSQLARPHVVKSDIEAGYKAMAEDKKYNDGATAWTEGTRDAIDDENVWE